MRATLLFVLPCLVACSLTTKATPLEIRYFSPEVASAHYADPPSQAPRPRLRIGRLTSSANLRLRIVHRESPVETSEYETLRWTENPETYVRRSLVAALLGQGLDQATGGSAPTLDVEVVGFEEVHHDSYHGGRVELRYQLRDERSVLASDVVVVERQAATGDIQPVVMVISAAMNAATAQIATAVAAQMVH